MKLRRQKLNIIEKKTTKKTKQKKNTIFNYYFDYSNPEMMFRRLRDSSDERNKSLVESINKKLTKLKEITKNAPKDMIDLKKMKK